MMTDQARGVIHLYLLYPLVRWTASGLLILSAIGSIAIFVHLIALPLFLAARDVVALRVTSLRSPATRRDIYDACRRLKTDWGRGRLLDGLLASKIEVEGENVPTPPEPWVTPAVLERLARLEEVWLSLEE